MNDRAALIALTALAALVVAFAPAIALAATFDLHLRPYCATADCGHASRAAYEDYLCAAVEQLNLEYEKVGLSFRPRVAANQAGAPAGGVAGQPPEKNQYSEIDVGDACDDVDPDAALAEHWRANVAAANPDEISYLLREGRDWNCSRFPWKPTPYGIIGDASMPRGARAAGALFAHEIGHYFGLLHTFTDQDPATNAPPAYDGDLGDATQNLPKVNDTPDDPLTRENCPRYCGGDPAADRCSTDADCTGSCLRVCNAGHDEDMNGNLVDGHVWTAVNEMPNTADPGSPNPDTCTLTWIERANGQSLATFPAVTQPHNSMSYYPATCTGPTVVGGVAIQPYSPQQIARMQESRQAYPERGPSTLPDVCLGHGGDTDQDGVCDDADTCRYLKNLCAQEADGDGDGRPDGCDNCADVPNADQEDTNHDGEGDACDVDDDGDGCFDDPALEPQDQHPDSSMAPIGSLLYSAYCTGEQDPTWYGFEGGGIDTDGDGVPDCADYDDDNDGECDDAGSHGPSTPGVLRSGCVGPDPCRLKKDAGALECTEFVDCPKTTWWDVCGFGSSCIELLLKMVSVINPDPTTEVVFEQFDIVNQKIFAKPAKGTTASQSATKVGALAKKQVSGQTAAAARASAAAAGERVALEIWRRTPSGGEERVVRVGEFDASTLRFGDVTRGPILRLVPEVDARTRVETLLVDTTYVAGIEDEGALPDSDADRRPDLVDSCPRAANPDQRDDDGDGYGNRCDPDLDNDLRVGDEDVARVRRCAGAELGVAAPLQCGHQGAVAGDAPDAVAAAVARWCAAADVNDDRRVDAADVALVAQLRGTALEPRSHLLPRPEPEPGCVESAPLGPAKLALRGPGGVAGTQTLVVTGEGPLPFPASGLDPLARGARVLLQTAQGRVLLDAELVPGAYTAGGAGWSANDARTRFLYADDRGGTGVGKATLKRVDRRGSARVKLRLQGRAAHFAVAADELPLSLKLTLDATAVATRQCLATGFAGSAGRSGCAARADGSVVCR